MPNTTHTRELSDFRLTYTVEEAAALLGIGRGLVYEMVGTGQLPSFRLGRRRIVIPRAALHTLLADAGASHAP